MIVIPNTLKAIRSLSHSAPGYRIQPISPAAKIQSNLSNTSQDTSADHHSKWFQPVLKSQQYEITI